MAHSSTDEEELTSEVDWILKKRPSKKRKAEPFPKFFKENDEDLAPSKPTKGNTRRPPIMVSQCKLCQSYGHTQNYCGKQPRCVKCAGKHKNIDCSKPETEQPQCCNCREAYPASYRGCRVAKKLQKMRSQKVGQEKKTELLAPDTTKSNQNNGKNSEKSMACNYIYTYVYNWRVHPSWVFSRAPPPICGERLDVATQMERPTVLSRLRISYIFMRIFFMTEIHSEICHCLPRDDRY